MAISIDRAPQALAADQRLVFERLSNLVRNTRLADAAYDRLPAAKSGRFISVDVARYLANEFRSWDGRIRHTPSTGIPAGAYAHDRLLREIAARKPSESRPVLLITAGGAGSGKTTLLKESVQRATLTFDNQLRNYERGSAILDAALSAGWKVQVKYVHRPFQDVVQGVLERSQRTGRWNSLAELAASHFEAQQTVIRLRKRFLNRVQFRAIYNVSDAFAGDRERGARVFFFELAASGCYHIPNASTLQGQVPQVVKACVKEGRVCEQVARLVLRQGLAT